MALKLYDITRPMEPGMGVWPGDTLFRVEWTAQVATGDRFTAAALRMSSHAGTHADAPSHLIEGAPSIDGMTLHPYIGPALVVELPGSNPIDAESLAYLDLAAVERLLIRTGVSPPDYGFDGHYRSLAPEAADLLAQFEVLLVGIDAPSVDAFSSCTLETHQRLLSSGIAILECLDLRRIPEGVYELLAVPLKLAGLDSSPVRAILRELPARP